MTSPADAASLRPASRTSTGPAPSHRDIDDSIPATKQWSFAELVGDSLLYREVSSGAQVGGELHELFDFGSAYRDLDIVFPDGSSLPRWNSDGPDRVDRERHHLLGGRRRTNGNPRGADGQPS